MNKDLIDKIIEEWKKTNERNENIQRQIKNIYK